MLKPIKPVDKKAPRFRWSAGRHVVLNESLFKSYKTEVENPIEDFSLFRDVIQDYNEIVKQEVLSNRDGVKLPSMMGIMAVCSYKTGSSSQRPPINWAASSENGVKLKEFNLHTGGLACKIVYSCYTAKYKFRNWALWKFEGNRDFKTKVSKYFEKNYNNYKRLDNKSHVSKMFKDDYITKRYNLDDNIGINIEHKEDEQAGQRGQSPARQIHL